MQFVLDRMKEPSTHAGIAAVLVALSTVPFFAPYAIFLQGAAVMFGSAGVVTKERK